MDSKELNIDNLRDSHWIGEVVDNSDPLLDGRCRVRVFGKFDNIPTSSIPWATPSNRNTPGAHAVPRVGDIVAINFDNGDIYHPEYIYHVNQNSDFKSDILSESGAPQNCISLVYDAVPLLITCSFSVSSDADNSDSSSLNEISRDDLSAFSLVFVRSISWK